MGNPESESFRAIVDALLGRETAEHVEHWYDHEPLQMVSAQIPVGKRVQWGAITCVAEITTGLSSRRRLTTKFISLIQL